MTIKILCLTTSYPLQENSNSGIFVARLAAALGQHSAIQVLTPAYNRIIGRLPRNPPVYAFRYAPAAWQTLCHSAGGIPAAMKRNRGFLLLVPLLLLAMLFHTIRLGRKCAVIQANWAIGGAIAGIAGIFCRTRVFTTLRGDDMNNAKANSLNKLFLLLAIKYSEKIITVSEDLAKQLHEQFNVPLAKIVFIPNGVGDDFVLIGHNRDYSIQDCSMQGCAIQNSAEHSGKLKILALGSLIPRKNIGFLLNNLPQLANSVQLTIAGDGEEEESLRALVETLELKNCVTFVGKIAPDQVANILRNHDVLVMPSLSEGRSNAIYEAMAAGMVVVASDIAGTREQIIHHETGYLFSLQQPQELISYLSQLQNHRQQLSLMGSKAHQWIINNNLTWQTSAVLYLQLFTRHTDLVQPAARPREG